MEKEFKEISEALEKVVDRFVYGVGVDYEYWMEWGDRFKSTLTEKEKASFREWEEMVGYTVIESVLAKYITLEKPTYKKYNCEDPKLESALYVVKHSERLLDVVIYLQKERFSERALERALKYLIKTGE